MDFSDRVDGKRKSYKASSRRQRILEDGTQELGDLSDDDDAESLERRIARLIREVQEAKNEYAKQHSTNADSEPSQSEVRLDTLSQILDDIGKPTAVTYSKGGSAQTFIPTSEPQEKESGVASTYTVTYAPTYEQSHALAKAADFDRRLLALERGLGLSTSSEPEVGDNGLPRAILPSLDTMEKQISTIAQASTANLDAISRRVRTLAQDQDKLNDARERSKALREELGRTDPSSSMEDSEQDTKINALYAILPTIESLTPMLPPLLDRLRSLRAIHSDAASASQTLDQIEQRQAEMTTEIKQWNEGLSKLETAIKDGDATGQNNMKVIEGWVKELEQRVTSLS